MKRKHLTVLVPGIFAAAALTLAVGVGAQTSPHAGHTQAAKSPEAAPMADSKADMKADCKAMMAKKDEMQVKLQEMDVALDKLVAEMNAAKADAMEKPMAAVINELVAQRKASHAMKKEMDAEMMGHMDMHGTKGKMECPMMKAGMTH